MFIALSTLPDNILLFNKTQLVDKKIDCLEKQEYDAFAIVAM
jgi:hypothetical protein